MESIKPSQVTLAMARERSSGSLCSAIHPHSHPDALNARERSVSSYFQMQPRQKAEKAEIQRESETLRAAGNCNCKLSSSRPAAPADIVKIKPFEPTGHPVRDAVACSEFVKSLREYLGEPGYRKSHKNAYLEKEREIRKHIRGLIVGKVGEDWVDDLMQNFRSKLKLRVEGVSYWIFCLRRDWMRPLEAAWRNALETMVEVEQQRADRGWYPDDNKHGRWEFIVRHVDDDGVLQGSKQFTMDDYSTFNIGARLRDTNEFSGGLTVYSGPTETSGKIYWLQGLDEENSDDDETREESYDEDEKEGYTDSDEEDQEDYSPDQAAHGQSDAGQDIKDSREETSDEHELNNARVNGHERREESAVVAQQEQQKEDKDDDDDEDDKRGKTSPARGEHPTIAKFSSDLLKRENEIPSETIFKDLPENPRQQAARCWDRRNHGLPALSLPPPVAAGSDATESSHGPSQILFYGYPYREPPTYGRHPRQLRGHPW